MKNVIHFLDRFQRRSLLIGAAVLLLLIYLGRWVNDTYDARQVDVDSKRAQLEQYQLVTGKAKSYDERLGALVRLKEERGKYFFTGENDDKISSAMQLRIQALVAKAGLQAESIRPMVQKSEVRQDKDGGGEALGEVIIKARLAGTLAEFMGFIADLYRGKEFFGIESISLKPYRNTGLKIFIELKGYYLLLEQKEDSGDAKN